MRAVSPLQTPLTDPASLSSLNLPVALRPNENDLERFDIAACQILMLTLSNDNPWIMNLIVIRDKETERERDTDTRIFRAHEYTRSLSQTITQTLTSKHTRRMCVCVCVFARAVCDCVIA